MSEFRVDQIKNQAGTRGPEIAGITTFSGVSGIVMPSGSTEYRGGRGRAVFASGYTPGATDVIDYITIPTTGNAVDFGNTTTSYRSSGQTASSTRGIISGGITVPGSTNRSTIEYITISSTGNSFDSGGDLTETGHNMAAFSSPTRSCFAGRVNPSVLNTIDYIVTATLGNAIDFGDISYGEQGLVGCSSPTRGIFGGGTQRNNTVNYVTISTTGDAQDFGDLTGSSNGHSRASLSNSTRGIFAGGYNSPGAGPFTTTIDYFTIASLGDGVDFGDLTSGRAGMFTGSNSIRGVFGAGNTATSPAVTVVNTVDYITIATLGNASDFGDLTQARTYGYGGMSDAHGGLGD